MHVSYIFRELYDFQKKDEVKNFDCARKQEIIFQTILDIKQICSIVIQRYVESMEVCLESLKS